MKIVDGGVCAVKGVLAAGACDDEYGVAVVVCKDCDATAVFTSNKIVAAPVILTKDAVQNGKLSAVVANSGNANCFTGDQGLEDGKAMASIVAEELDFNSNDIAVASTGVIGRLMPMNIIGKLIKKAVSRLENSNEASKNAAEAIMTTDTYSKEFAVETKLKNGKSIRIGGITKGSGMIAPNMGTMLCFITTDVKASASQLNDALKKAVDASFNMVVVDGDESTNDTVVLMANGESGESIDENFEEALEYLCCQLASMMAKDGEGATKFMEVEVNGALNTGEARLAAKAVVSSSLVKTALFGADPNWGRIIAAVGYSGSNIDPALVSVSIESNDKMVMIVDNGVVNAFEGTAELEEAEDIMEEKNIRIVIDLGLGNGKATAYGCDLSYDYVNINAEYTT